MYSVILLYLFSSNINSSYRSRFKAAENKDKFYFLSHTNNRSRSFNRFLNCRLLKIKSSDISQFSYEFKAIAKLSNKYCYYKLI